MIVQNNTNYKVKIEWNRHLRQDVLYVLTNIGWTAMGAIRQGNQSFAEGLHSKTVLEDGSARVDCDLQTAKTTLTSECIR